MNNSLSKSLYTHALISIMFTLLNGLFAFYINSIFGEYLGKESLGYLRLFSQIVGYLNLAELGVTAAAASVLYKLFNEKKYNEIKDILYTVDYFYKRIAIFVFIVGLAFAFILPYLSETISFQEKVIWIVYSSATSLTFVYSRYILVFTSDQNYNIVQLTKNVIKVVLQCIQVFIIIEYQSFILFTVSLLISNFVEWGCYKVIYNHKYKELRYISKRTKNSRLIKSTGKVFYHKIAGVIVFSTDYILITKFLSISIVAVYSSYLMIFQFITLVINNLALVIKPKVGVIITSSNSDKKECWNLFNIVGFYFATISLIVCYVSVNGFIELWMGKDYILEQVTVWFMLINFYIGIVRIPTDIVKEVSGYFDDIHLPILEGALNLFISLILVFYIGLNGIIIGTLISNITVLLILKPYVVCKRILICDYLFYVKRNLLLLGISAISFSLSIYLLDYINVSLFPKVCLSILTAIFCSTITFIIDKDFRYILKNFILSKVIKESI